MEQLFSGIWWIDALRVWGIAFLLLLPSGFGAWWVLDKLRWRRRDAAEVARLSLVAPKNTEAGRDQA